jgi:hypothetical protein
MLWNANWRTTGHQTKYAIQAGHADVKRSKGLSVA